MSPPPDDDVFIAAQITVVFLLEYAFTFANGLATKKRLLRQARKENKVFNRYTSPQMHAADRLNANFLEWSPIFLGLIWSLAATKNLSPSCVAAAWTYIALRALYIVLILRYGVALDGMNKPLWASTFPGYVCLMYMTSQAIGKLFL